MGEVGLNTGEIPTTDTDTLKMNGDLNGSCPEDDNDEPMDVDPLEDASTTTTTTTPTIDENDKKLTDALTEDDERSNGTEDSSVIKEKDETQSSIPDDQDDEEDPIILQNGDINEEESQEGAASEDLVNSDEDDENKIEKVTTTKNDDDDVDDDELIEGMEVDGLNLTNSNGHAEEEDDEEDEEEDDGEKPVSIHSDSDIEEIKTIEDEKTPEKQQKTDESKPSNGECKTDEIHEILSDKEDCIVIDDVKDTSPRRSSRQRKSVVKVRDFSVFDDDDVQEIDPLQTTTNSNSRKSSSNSSSMATASFMGGGQISIKDARSLALPHSTTITKSTSNNKKEPTLVIIDTNNIMAARSGSRQPQIPGLTKQQQNQLQNAFSVLPMGVPAQGVYPQNMSASITPVAKAPLLPSLTDDMFVLEAPSFIVPYIYEKPPSENLKEIVTKIGEKLLEQAKIEKKEEKMKSEEGKDDEDSKDTEKDEDGNEKKSKDRSRKKTKNPDDSWDESDTSTDEEASDTEQRTKILIKEANEDMDDIKKHIITPDTIKTTQQQQTVQSPLATVDPLKKNENYFESPLGKFFMTIGINLVQEHVQTDLLRQQKKKIAREGKAPPQMQLAINSLMKNLEFSREKNEPFKFNMKRCEYCNFKSESSLAMANHYETPHMKNYLYKCNFCPFETRPPHDILYHMEAVHNIKGRLEKSQSYHACPNCPFEDNGKSKLGRHSVVCAKKFRPEVNLTPPIDWEPPAKIPRIKPKHGLVGTATAYQAMTAQQQRAAASMLSRPNPAAMSQAALMRARGRPQQTVTKPTGGTTILRGGQQGLRNQIAGGMMIPNNYQIAAGGSQFLQAAGTSMAALLPNSHSSLTIQSSSGSKSSKSIQQPSISITPLPRQSAQSTAKPGMQNMKPGQNPTAGGKATFVICEICDGYIKDLDQLRNHMQWIHKVKIHPKMIYNRPPLNCQKCQFRFFTDQGLERHLLGSHGLVTSSMQEAANKGKDAGRCPVCGRVYQWKLLNHVSRDHNMTLKPAHLSYKCTVCTATFGMYKQFENHVYSAHSTVAKKAMDGKKNVPSSSSGSSKLGGGDSLLKPLKINDEITIIPQPAKGKIEIESHVID